MGLIYQGIITGLGSVILFCISYALHIVLLSASLNTSTNLLRGVGAASNHHAQVRKYNNILAPCPLLPASCTSICVQNIGPQIFL
jgi:hypothetical protein